MPKKNAFPLPSQDRPSCGGCDRCGGFSLDDLYAWTGRRWVCKDCYYRRK